MKFKLELLFLVKFVLIIFILSFFNSCTIEKRKYLAGYHIEGVNHKDLSSKKVNLQIKKQLDVNLKSDLDRLCYKDSFNVKVKNIDTAIIPSNIKNFASIKIWIKLNGLCYLKIRMR